MEFKLTNKAPKGHRIYILGSNADLSGVEGLQEGQEDYLKEAFKATEGVVSLNQYSHQEFFLRTKVCKTEGATQEALRKGGAALIGALHAMKAETVCFYNLTEDPQAALSAAEGLALAAYQFLKYKTEGLDKMTHTLRRIDFAPNAASKEAVARLEILTDAVFAGRDLVNEPLSTLTAVALAKAFEKMGKDSGFKTTVLHKKEIEKEGMGGLLAVNLGSQDPPTFSIMEYKPKKAHNKKPIVLIGKGIVYDTGGLSLKPTPNSMDRMKSDMGGAALVGATMAAIAKLKLPLHVIALVPATDNRPGENAYVPGDVITMYSGKTVEVLNTDAEGRMVLADALQWAKRYHPELVFDFATLTGAASAAIGEHGIVCMGTAGEEVKAQLRAAGERQYERLVEFPLWEEYGAQIKSDVADIKNVGGATGGAITAGKFLEHFTDYPWMHFDIAGVSFNTSKKDYRPLGGTAYGVRMLVDFLESMI
jgi:leucyl aminopeptidase